MKLPNWAIWTKIGLLLAAALILAFIAGRLSMRHGRYIEIAALREENRKLEVYANQMYDLYWTNSNRHLKTLEEIKHAACQQTANGINSPAIISPGDVILEYKEKR